MVDTLARLDSLTAIDQPEEGVTYAHKIDKSEARLDFTQPAEAMERAVRAFNPAPGAFVEVEGERLKILAANVVEARGVPGTVLDDALTIACGCGALRPTLVQRAGKPAMAVRDLLNGWSIAAGTRIA